MDDVVQKVKIEDIVPRSNHNQEDIKTLEELITSIKDNGIKEPLILKRKNNRYEIISGTRRYKAAIIAGLSEVPAIIKSYDNNISQNSIKNNSDIINLSELNKEYERDEFNMNNEFMNNNNIEQSINNVGVTPSFGGRFFPSLEDEPTNMSFNQNIEPTPSSQNPVLASATNNFIDLTDTSSDFQNNNIADVTPVENQNYVQPTPTQTAIPNENIDNNLNQSSVGNVINLENLAKNNGMIQPTSSPIPNANIDNNFQEIINDFQPNQGQFMTPPNNQVIETPTTLASQAAEAPTPTNLNIEPQQNIQPEAFNQINNPLDNAFNNSQQSVVTPQPEVTNNSIANMNMQTGNIVPNVVQPLVNQEPALSPSIQVENSIQAQQQKDVLPVINVLKSVGTNLESFGYTIRITDEDLPNSYKITIEVEK